VLLAVGLALGVGGAFAIRRAIETQLYGVGGMDPIVLLSVGAVLGLVALVACIVPARRASKIEPILALAER
jgi:ABC-type antimicrobial peptide transport system permease subunit